MGSIREIEFDLAKARALRGAYDAAARGRAETFQFEGHTIVVGYAYYLLEHLAGVLGEPSLKPERRAHA